MGGYPVPVTTVEEKDAGGLNDPPIPQVCTARPQGLNPKPQTLYRRYAPLSLRA
jgi:hypothetical protein